MKMPIETTNHISFLIFYLYVLWFSGSSPPSTYVSESPSRDSSSLFAFFFFFVFFFSTFFCGILFFLIRLVSTTILWFEIDSRGEKRNLQNLGFDFKIELDLEFERDNWESKQRELDLWLDHRFGSGGNEVKSCINNKYLNLSRILYNLHNFQIKNKYI